MNNLDKQYTDLLQDILDNGVAKQDRTGTGTLSVFGRQIRHKMSEGFPLLTTKKMPFRLIATELLWFLRGDTNIKFLVDNECHIWDGDAYKKYHSTWEMDTWGVLDSLSQEKFINKIKTDFKFAEQWGDLGPVYGAQWRAWGGYDKIPSGYNHGSVTHFRDVPKNDQLADLINGLKTNPDSRRLMVNAWNVGELDQMTLPPCHYGFQVYTRELSLEERVSIWDNKFLKDVKPEEVMDNLDLDGDNIPKRAISLIWNQRSVDTFLGLPFNIASYGLLLEIIAKEVNMVPDELIGNLGDTHLYLNHVEQAKEQIGRELTLKERYKLWPNKDNEFAKKTYNSTTDKEFKHGFLSSRHQGSVPRRTREPFPLPKLFINDEFWNHDYQTIDGWINSMEIGDFQLENYQSHPHIKASLSN